MSKYCAENERVKRDYAFFLEAANGKQSATIDAALRAIVRFETSTIRKPFRKFHIEQARSLRARLGKEIGANGRPLSAATIASTLKHLRNFFLWLSPIINQKISIYQFVTTFIGVFLFYRWPTWLRNTTFLRDQERKVYAGTNYDVDHISFYLQEFQAII
jgi:predicted AAA+ superfamily ATPase